MLAVLDLSTSHNTLYDSKLRRTRNCIDVARATSKIRHPEPQYVVSPRALDTIYGGLAAATHADFRVLGNRGPKSGAAPGDQSISSGVCTNVHIGKDARPPCAGGA